MHASELHYSHSILQGLINYLVKTIAVEAILPYEVRVLNSLFGRDTAGGIVDEKSIEKIEAHVVEGGDGRGDVGALPFGERRLEVGEGCDARPLLF